MRNLIIVLHFIIPLITGGYFCVHLNSKYKIPFWKLVILYIIGIISGAISVYLNYN